MSSRLILAGFAVFLAASVFADGPPTGFVSLFDGKTLDGWQVVGGKKGAWSVRDGILTCNGGGGGWLMSRAQYRDFDLTLDYRISKHGNSGVAIRSPLRGRPSEVGMEIQILDDPTYKGLKPTQHTGSIYGVVPPRRQAGKPAGEWNRMRIVCRGRQVRVELNGETLVDANLDDHRDTAVKEHPGILRRDGHLGLQDHGGTLEFRNLHIKELK